MWTFQYKHGDRPLEGFTIERGAGRGGFGEVYYAISDSGREVALKAIQGYEQIELRGISNCMNLKNPHLVTIFDVKFNEAGKPFVIMEFVAGPSLRQLLDESPSGLGTQKAAFFLREIGKGLTFLHDNGIVHRDLKPANIFYENGYVKIGDYGLSKAIAPTQHSAQTVTVGTVHYMAPEIGAGKYDRSIDIYALGAVLYEMLAGMVPFTGATPSEILLKHLGTEIDVTNIPEPFASVIKKAMAKDPTQRYQSVQEMVEAVFGAEHVRQSVSVFSPDELSVVAGHAALRAATAAGAGGGGSPTAAQTGAVATESDPWLRVGAWANRVTDRIAGVGERATDAGGRALRHATGASSKTMEVAPFVDPLSRGHRKLIAFIIALGFALAAGLLSQDRRQEPVIVMPFVFLMIIGGATGAQLALRRLVPQVANEAPLVRQLSIGGLAVLLGVLFSLPLIWGVDHVSSNIAGTWLATFAPLFFMNVAAWAAPDRNQRVSFWDTTVLAGFFGFIIATMCQGSWAIAALTPAGICALTQILSPWNKEAARQRAEREERGEEAERPAWGFNDAQQKTTGGVMPPPLPTLMLKYWSRPVPGWARLLWLVLTTLSFAIGVSFLVAAGMTNSRNDFGPYLGVGMGFLVGSLLFLIQACRSRFYGWWSYLGRPILILAAGIAIVIAVTFIATVPRLHAEETAFAVFVMIMSTLTFIVVWFIPSGKRVEAIQTPTPAPASSSSATAPAPADVHPWYRRKYRARFRRRHGRAVGSAFFSLLAFFLILLAVKATLISALRLPEAVAAGLPDPSLARELNRDVFPDYPDWPRLIQSIARTIGIMLTLMAIGLCTIARRRAGMMHITRGLIALSMFVASFLVLGQALRHIDWHIIAAYIHANKPTSAVAQAMEWATGGLLIVAALMFIAAPIILVWPPREPRQLASDSRGGAA